MLTGRSQADGTFAISNVPPGRYVAIARSGGREQRPEDRACSRSSSTGRTSAACRSAAAGRDDVGQHHRRIVRHAGAGRLLGIPRRRARRDAAAVRRWRRRWRWRPRRTRRRRRPRGKERHVPDRQPAARASTTSDPGQRRQDGPGPGRRAGTVDVEVGHSSPARTSPTQPVELKPGQNVDNVTIVLTDRTTEIAGTVRDAQERAGGRR